MLRPLLLLMALASVARAETITEVVPVGDGFLARRDDGLVMIALRSTPRGHSIAPFSIPRDASPLVSDENSAWCRAAGDGGPVLLELRVDAPRTKGVHALPPGAGAPVAVDATSVHLDDGTRFDRATRQVIAGHRTPPDGSRVVAARGPCRLVRADDGAFSLETAMTSVLLPRADAAELTDVATGQAVVVLDRERALCLDVATLAVVRELTSGDAELLSAHVRDDGWWLHVGATEACPAALVSVGADGAEARTLALPDGVRVVGGGHRHVAIELPGADADRLLLADRRPAGDSRLRFTALRDRAARVGNGIAVGAGRAGLVVGFIPILMVAAAMEELDGPSEAELAKRHRRRLLEKLASFGVAWPDPGGCGAEIQPLTAGCR